MASLSCAAVSVSRPLSTVTPCAAKRSSAHRPGWMPSSDRTTSSRPSATSPGREPASAWAGVNTTPSRTFVGVTRWATTASALTAREWSSRSRLEGRACNRSDPERSRNRYPSRLVARIGWQRVQHAHAPRSTGPLRVTWGNDTDRPGNGVHRGTPFRAAVCQQAALGGHYAFAMTVSLERELKLDPPPGFELPPLEGSPLESRLFTSTYHDTPGLSLARAGITLRRRLENGKSRWQLKLPRDDGARAEIEVAGRPAGPPARLRGLLLDAPAPRRARAGGDAAHAADGDPCHEGRATGRRGDGRHGQHPRRRALRSAASRSSRSSSSGAAARVT